MISKADLKEMIISLRKHDYIGGEQSETLKNKIDEYKRRFGRIGF